MTLNQVGGALGVFALALLLALHDRTARRHIPVSSVAPASKVESPAPKPAPKPEPPKPEPSKKAVPKSSVPPGVKYRRVLPGGKLGPEVDCTFVRSFVQGKSKEELAALAIQYGVSSAELAKYKQCLN